jgi:hypothetical protein
MDIEEGAQELNVKVHKAEEPTKQIHISFIKVNPLHFYNVFYSLHASAYFIKQIFIFDFYNSDLTKHNMPQKKLF